MTKKFYTTGTCVILALALVISLLIITYEENKYTRRAEKWIVKDVENVAPITNLTTYEIDLIERVVECEVRGNNEKDYYGKLAVANVILNRYRSDYWEFPDTIEEIIFQKNQFTPVTSDVFNTITVTDLTKKAVRDALNGVMIIEPNVYAFCTVDCNGKEWFEENLVFYGHIAPHDFYSYKEN